MVATGKQTRRQVLGTGGGKWCEIEAISVGDTQIMRCCTIQEKKVLALVWMAAGTSEHAPLAGSSEWGPAIELSHCQRSQVSGRS